MQSGKVKWFNYKNGYGFIVPENGEKDVFVHVTAVHASNLRRLEENQAVTFELKEENGKMCAQNIKLI
jgi:CspA family cold shock protein